MRGGGVGSCSMEADRSGREKGEVVVARSRPKRLHQPGSDRLCAGRRPDANWRDCGTGAQPLVIQGLWACNRESAGPVLTVSLQGSCH